MEALLEGAPATVPRTAAAGDGLAQLMDELAHGVLVLGLPGARLLHANQPAREVLARGHLLQAVWRDVQACGPAAQAQLADALQQAARGRRSLLTLTHAGASLVVAVVPLRTDAAADPDRAALVFARASVCESLMLCFFARSHGLTPTEEHVLGILCQGYTAPEVAQQMRVAVSTVRSHVRSLCAKTRCGSVRELVNRVALLPPVGPAPLHLPMH